MMTMKIIVNPLYLNYPPSTYRVQKEDIFTALVPVDVMVQNLVS